MFTKHCNTNRGKREKEERKQVNKVNNLMMMMMMIFLSGWTGVVTLHWEASTPDWEYDTEKKR